jgi:cysteine-rich repeat protein
MVQKMEVIYLANLSSATAPTCAANINKDVWYSFTIVATKKYRININGPSIADPVVALYSGSCAALVQVACNDDFNGTYSSISDTLTAGNYILRVGSYNTTTEGTFSIVYDLNLTNICGDGILENTEECDDENTTNGDGCNSTCKIENAASITGVAINRDSVRANPSAMLDVKSFDKGILIPRMSSTQRTAIAIPAKGLLVFDITTNTFWYYTGTIWTEVGGTSGTAGGGLPVGTTSQTLRNSGTNWVANSILQNDGFNITTVGPLNVNSTIKISSGTPGQVRY